jgi:hypothetical protein
MAHIPMDDITQVWNDTPNSSWKGLEQSLVRLRGQGVGISDELVDSVIRMCCEFERSGKPFPSSQKELYELLNQQLQKTGVAGPR